MRSSGTDHPGAVWVDKRLKWDGGVAANTGFNTRGEMKVEDTRDACALAYELLRMPECPMDPPPAMANFVYETRLSPRAITVAQDSIEKDPAFRSFVAASATEADVGQAGMEWLGAIDLTRIDDLHRRIANLEGRLAETSHQLAEVSAQLLERNAQLTERTEQWRQALKDLSATQLQ